MNYKQLITPQLDPFIYVNGSPLSDWLGWCMGYVSSAFQVFGAASAHIGWTKSQFPHTDKDFPSGVYIPIWFDWYGNIDGTGVKNWGHVAIYKDGQVWSSPLSHKPTADLYQSYAAFVAAFANAGVNIQYVGWSEDLLGTKLIELEGEDMPKVLNTDQARQDYLLFGIEVAGDSPALVNAVGADELEFVKGMGPQVQNNLAAKDKAIADLQSKLSTAQAVNGDSTKWQTLGALLRELLGLNK